MSAVYSNGNLRALCKEGRLKEAVHILVLRGMDFQFTHLDFSTYAYILQACASQKCLLEGKLVHAHITQTVQFQGTILGNMLAFMYAKCSNLEDARKVFDQIPRRNVVSWNMLIAAHAKSGQGIQALKLYYDMKQTGIQPNQFTFVSVLQACAAMAALEQGKELHGEIAGGGFESQLFVGSALLNMYVKCGSIDDARQMFDKMPQRDLVVWNAMLGGYAQSGRVNEALELFGEMLERNVVSWTSMIAGFARNGYIEEARKLFEEMPGRNMVSWTAMIAGYAQHGRVDEAVKLFVEMPEKDATAWNVMIAGFAQNGFADEAMKLFQKMPQRNVVSWTTMVSGLADNGRVDEALKLFRTMPERDVASWNSVIAGCGQNGKVDEALRLFREMPSRNVVSWTAMIAGCTQNGYFCETLKLFKEMQLTGVKLNLDTLGGILPACANLGDLEQGKEVHEDVIRSGFQFSVCVANALVDMYAKCGSIQDACNVFDRMHQRNVISWTSMISGYAMHGCGKEALRLFKQMQQSGICPDRVTFVGLLSACSHAGLVDDGRQIFDCMIQYYQITPSVEHCCLMVDLLGRAGRMHEAQDFINNMPVKPDIAVWVSLLGACRKHTDIHLGETVAERLFELDPKNAAPYVLLANLYAASGKWDDIQKVRKMMKYRGVIKNPGQSWIEVNKQVHAFVSGDRSHPQASEILAELERLSGLLIEAGYVSDMRFVLNNVEGEQKGHILCHHSEKLALAFGLINTSPGTPIRIVKNLRVCGDCHSAIKIISKIVARAIVLRDANRFHHFKDGYCSCRDYW